MKKGIIIIGFLAVLVGAISFLLWTKDGCACKTLIDDPYAYFEVFKEIYKDGGAVPRTYLAVDLSEINLSDSAILMEHIKEFSENKSYELIFGTYEELIEQGIWVEGLNDDFYRNGGASIYMKTGKIKGKSLLVEATMVCGSLCANGYEYKVIKTGDTWKVNKTGKTWVS